jgi:uncharacterized protein
MSELGVGRVGWVDLTVENAEALRDFYAAVVGWSTSEVDRGGYSDFGMHPAAGGDMVAGICHARGPNREIPPQWLVYITVADLDRSMDACQARGGEVIAGPRDAGNGRYCVVRDPAGAVCALYEAAGPAAH